MYQALYRKYRPQTFDDVVGQMAVTQTLKQQLTSGQLSHAYLFTGTRGTGKTSCAKILAKAVNCENPQNGNPCNCCAACRAIDSGSCLDVLEIDAASNNGVDNVRDLRDEAVYSPSQVKKRVYIIDEVHMLSVPAFNALLKILEEPPEHLLFILATTELHKVPVTILSRCQRFSFGRIRQEDIAARLHYVAYEENIDLEDSAARLLARMADGGMRDALSLLDQCAGAATGSLTAQTVYDCLGLAGERSCAQLMGYIAGHNTKEALALFDKLYALGKDLGALVDELACLTRDLLVLQTAPEAGLSMLSGVATTEDAQQLKEQFAPGELVRMLGLLQETAAGFTRSDSRRVDVELCLIKLCRPELQPDVQALNARMGRLEQQLRAGVLVAAAPAPVSQNAPRTVEVPPDFWPVVSAAVRRELNPPVSGFFQCSERAPVQCRVEGDRVVLLCINSFVMEFVDKPQVLRLVEEKAKEKVGQPMTAVAVDLSAGDRGGAAMEELLKTARQHQNIIHVDES